MTPQAAAKVFGQTSKATEPLRSKPLTSCNAPCYVGLAGVTLRRYIREAAASLARDQNHSEASFASAYGSLRRDPRCPRRARPSAPLREESAATMAGRQQIIGPTPAPRPGGVYP